MYVLSEYRSSKRIAGVRGFETAVGASDIVTRNSFIVSAVLDPAGRDEAGALARTRAMCFSAALIAGVPTKMNWFHQPRTEEHRYTAAAVAPRDGKQRNRQ